MQVASGSNFCTSVANLSWIWKNQVQSKEIIERSIEKVINNVEKVITKIEATKLFNSY